LEGRPQPAWICDTANCQMSKPARRTRGLVFTGRELVRLAWELPGRARRIFMKSVAPSRPVKRVEWSAAAVVASWGSAFLQRDPLHGILAGDAREHVRVALYGLLHRVHLRIEVFSQGRKGLWAWVTADLMRCHSGRLTASSVTSPTFVRLRRPFR
jgi:hypothetical protein